MIAHEYLCFKNYRSAQELMEDDEQSVSKQMNSPNSAYEVFQHQLQRTASMCQSLLGEQSQDQPPMGLLQTSSLPSPAGNDSSKTCAWSFKLIVSLFHSNLLYPLSSYNS